MQFKSQVLTNVEVSPGYFRMRMTAPPAALAAEPGQFVMIRVNGAIDPLLRRPFGIYDLGSFATRSWLGAGSGSLLSTSSPGSW